MNIAFQSLAGGLADAPADGKVYARQDANWVSMPEGAASLTVLDKGEVIAAELATLDFVGAGVTARGDGAGNVTVTIDAVTGGDAGMAALTAYDNTTSELAATDVQGALDQLAARTGSPIVALIAGADASAAVKAATDYVEDDSDIETVIATALADGYRTFLLAGTCTATAVVDIDTADGVYIAAAPGGSLAGDLAVSTSGADVRLDAPVHGTITDANNRVARPVLGAGAQRIVVLKQADYDALGTPDAATLYVITDAT